MPGRKSMMLQDTYRRLRNRRSSGRDRRPEGSRYSSSGSTAQLKKEQKTPLAIELLKRPASINPQALCPIFAKLPRELREQIWDLALTRYEDLNNLYNIKDRVARPGQAAPLRIAVKLLLTCRAIYVESFLKPFLLNPMAVFDGDAVDIPGRNPLTRATWDPLTCYKLKFWQFANISSVEITAQQFTLEGGTLERVARLVGTRERHKGYESRGYTIAGYPSFVEPKESRNDAGEPSKNLLIGRKITHLKLRMNRTDWWSWSSHPADCESTPSDRLRLEPMINVTDIEAKPENNLAMTIGYEARKAGREPDFGLDDFEKQGRWGLQIGEYWPDLVTFELVLETFACKKAQLDYVVQCAKLWSFPLNDRYQLSWNGKEDAVRWRGAQLYDHDDAEWWSFEQNTFRSTKAEDPTLIQWRPTTEDDSAGQEFIIRTLTFERKRNEDHFGRSRP
ncbi:hypothetical protein F5Y05DRAFT_364060 [Hypoxylon sp. FL0543]|nr:hypothetical protein F5Y05DRAFT_364060 [Hypoxylon sp. FL0543]